MNSRIESILDKYRITKENSPNLWQRVMVDDLVLLENGISKSYDVAWADYHLIMGEPDFFGKEIVDIVTQRWNAIREIMLIETFVEE